MVFHPIQREYGALNAVGIPSHKGAKALGIRLVFGQRVKAKHHVHQAPISVRHANRRDPAAPVQAFHLHSAGIFQGIFGHGMAIGGHAIRAGNYHIAASCSS